MSKNTARQRLMVFIHMLPRPRKHNKLRPRVLEVLRRCLYRPFHSPGWPCSRAESSKDQPADEWKSSFKGMPRPLVRAGHKATPPHSQDLSSHASLLGLAFTLNIQVFVGNTSSTSLLFLYLEPWMTLPLVVVVVVGGVWWLETHANSLGSDPPLDSWNLRRIYWFN